MDADSARARDCLDKLTWVSKEAAEAAAIYARWQYGDSQTKPTPYHCRHCGKWHLASG